MHEESKTALYELLFKTVQTIVKETKRYLGNNSSQEEGHLEALAQHKIALKMSVFLFQGFIVKEEGVQAKKVAANKGTTVRHNSVHFLVNTTQGRGRKKAVTDSNSVWELEKEKEKSLDLLLSIWKGLDLVHLWRGHPEEEFGALFTKVAFKMFENPANTKSASIKKKLFELIGEVSKAPASSSLNMAVHIVHGLLCKYESASPALVDLMEAFVTQYKNNEIVENVLKEIGKLDPKDLSHNTAAAKGMQNFLASLSSKLPNVVLPNVVFLLPILDGEVRYRRLRN